MCLTFSGQAKIADVAKNIRFVPTSFNVVQEAVSLSMWTIINQAVKFTNGKIGHGGQQKPRINITQLYVFGKKNH